MIEFTRAAAGTGSLIMVAAAVDDSDPYEQSARLYTFAHNDQHNPWYYQNLSFDIQSIEVFSDRGISGKNRNFVCLSSEGKVYHDVDPNPYVEKIAGAGNVGEKQYGRVFALRQIGSHLYAVGANGQLYIRRERDDWTSLSSEIMTSLDELAGNFDDAPDVDDPAFIDWILSQENNVFHSTNDFLDIGGTDEDDIYICGERGLLYHYDGSNLTKLESGTSEALTAICVGANDDVWICGRNGTLLWGNRRSGFTDVSHFEDNQLFTSIAMWNEEPFFVSSAMPSGLFRFDMTSRIIQPVDFIENEPVIHTISVIENVIWVVGLKTIYRRADGALEWEKISHPDIR